MHRCCCAAAMFNAASRLGLRLGSAAAAGTLWAGGPQPTRRHASCLGGSGSEPTPIRNMPRRSGVSVLATPFGQQLASTPRCLDSPMAAQFTPDAAAEIKKRQMAAAMDAALNPNVVLESPRVPP